MTLPLSGVGVLVTRPAGQAAGLAQRIRDLGGTPLLFPALAILPPRDPAVLAHLIEQLERFDLAIFVSPTAAQQGLAAVRRPWPERVGVAAIGKGTAEALRQAGIATVIAPEAGADSEHLLALAALQDMAGKRVLILRGTDGRAALGEALAARGAEVVYGECYRRALPDADPAPVLQAWAEHRLHAVTVFSAETLDHLFTLLGAPGRPALQALPLFAPHPRIAEHARALGVTAATATAPGDTGVVAGLVEYFAHA